MKRGGSERCPAQAAMFQTSQNPRIDLSPPAEGGWRLSSKLLQPFPMKDHPHLIPPHKTSLKQVIFFCDNNIETITHADISSQQG